MQASKGDRYSSISQAFFAVIEKEGWKGLYKGVGPTTQRACFLTGSQLPSYDHFKHFVLKNEWMKEGKPLHFLSSMVAGWLTGVAVVRLSIVAIGPMLSHC
jgi:hypothetical protein